MEQNITENKIDNKNLKGLGGWLIFIAIGLIGGVLSIIAGILGDFSILITHGKQGDLLYIFALLLTFCMGIFNTFLIYFFFKKSKNFPHLYIIFLFANLIYTPIIIWFNSSLFALLNVQPPESSLQPFRLPIALVITIIWIMYIKKSKRVKQTFIS